MVHRFTLKDVEILTDNEILVQIIQDRMENIDRDSAFHYRLSLIRIRLACDSRVDTLKKYLKWIGKIQ